MQCYPYLYNHRLKSNWDLSSKLSWLRILEGFVIILPKLLNDFWYHFEFSLFFCVQSLQRAFLSAHLLWNHQLPNNETFLAHFPLSPHPIPRAPCNLTSSPCPCDLDTVWTHAQSLSHGWDLLPELGFLSPGKPSGLVKSPGTSHPSPAPNVYPISSLQSSCHLFPLCSGTPLPPPTQFNPAPVFPLQKVAMVDSWIRVHVAFSLSDLSQKGKRLGSYTSNLSTFIKESPQTTRSHNITWQWRLHKSHQQPSPQGVQVNLV